MKMTAFFSGDISGSTNSVLQIFYELAQLSYFKKTDEILIIDIVSIVYQPLTFTYSDT